MNARRPGTRLRALAERLVDQTTFERVVLPALADLQHECAPSAGLVVRLRAYWACMRLFGWFALRRVALDAGYVLPMVVRRTGLLLVLFTGLLVYPACRDELPRLARLRVGVLPSLIVVLSLLPQALFLAWLPAHFIGLATSARPVTPTDHRRQHVGVIITSLACVVVMFVIANVVTPAANERYRLTIFTLLNQTHHDGNPVRLSKGLAEMSWSELGNLIRNPPNERRAVDARIHRQQRVALCLAPLVLGLVALRLAGRSRSRLASFAVSILVFVVYALLFALGTSAAHSPNHWITAVWLANVVFLLAALVRNVSPREVTT